ncbi:MAG: exodeoxyribonuclease VII small subunit [Muribaculaceae bacterium]|nr:exodeoxyribonuclease VII small subunit [Muribaculaceae bacterium]
MDFRPVGELTYAQSVAELESIIRMMQSDKCDIDNLAAYTRRAADLLRACRTRLTATEEELESVLKSLTENN